MSETRSIILFGARAEALYKNLRKLTPNTESILCHDQAKKITITYPDNEMILEVIYVSAGSLHSSMMSVIKKVLNDADAFLLCPDNSSENNLENTRKQFSNFIFKLGFDHDEPFFAETLIVRNYAQINKDSIITLPVLITPLVFTPEQGNSHTAKDAQDFLSAICEKASFEDEDSPESVLDSNLKKDTNASVPVFSVLNGQKHTLFMQETKPVDSAVKFSSDKRDQPGP